MRYPLPILFVLAMASAAPAQAQSGFDPRIEEASCNMGSALSCQVMGSAYALGNGVPKDTTRAATYYRRACQGGNMQGCRGLGILHAVGEGVGQDFGQAETLFRQACGAGDSESCRLADLAKADKERSASQQAASHAPPPSPSSALPPGHPVTPGGAACETVELLDKQSGLGSTGHTRFTYKLSNDSRCGVIWIELVAGDVEYNERRLAPGETRQFLCFTGLSHEPNCGSGITGWSVRLGK